MALIRRAIKARWQSNGNALIMYVIIYLELLCAKSFQFFAATMWNEGCSFCLLSRLYYDREWPTNKVSIFCEANKLCFPRLIETTLYFEFFQVLKCKKMSLSNFKFIQKNVESLIFKYFELQYISKREVV